MQALRRALEMWNENYVCQLRASVVVGAVIMAFAYPPCVRSVDLIPAEALRFQAAKIYFPAPAE